MTDEQIDRKILDALATVRSPEAWTALTRAAIAAHEAKAKS